MVSKFTQFINESSKSLDIGDTCIYNGHLPKYRYEKCSIISISHDGDRNTYRIKFNDDYITWTTAHCLKKEKEKPGKIKWFKDGKFQKENVSIVIQEDLSLDDLFRYKTGQGIPSKYNIGDIVYYDTGYQITHEFIGKNKVIDIIEDNAGEYWYCLEKTKGKSIKWIHQEDLSGSREEYEKAKTKRVRKIERDKKKLENKKRIKEEHIRKTKDMMKEVDPYGEEDWFNDNVLSW
jgi:hypothetical protein